MLEPRPPRPSALPRRSITPPSVPPPPPVAERRVAFRRAADRTAHEERTFLARALDVLAADAPAEERLAACLRCSPGPRAPAGRPSSPTAPSAGPRSPSLRTRTRRPARRWPPGWTRPPSARAPSAPPPAPRACRSSTTAAATAPLASTARRASGAAGAGSATGAVTYARVAVPPLGRDGPRLRVRRSGPTPPGSRRACRPASPATRPWPWRSSPPSSPPSATRRCCGPATPSATGSCRPSPTSCGRRSPGSAATSS